MSDADTILAAARQLLDPNTPGRLSMTAVARHAGVSRSTLYRCFPSRATLLDRLELSGTSARSRIMEATIDQIARHAKVDATVDELAEHAGVASVTVYRLFQDKHSLIVAAIDSIVPRQQLHDALTEEGLELAGRLERVARIIMPFLNEYPGILSVALLPGTTSVRRAERSTRTLLAALFEAEIANGHLAPNDPGVLVPYFVAMVVAQPVMFRRHHPESPFDADTEARRVVRMFLAEFAAEVVDE